MDRHRKLKICWHIAVGFFQIVRTHVCDGHCMQKPMVVVRPSNVQDAFIKLETFCDNFLEWSLEM